MTAIMALRIAMLGAPGAGKGTQAKRVAETRGVPHISTGDIFRDHLRRNTALGAQVRQYLDSGQLAPDRLVCEVVAQRLAEADCAEGYVLDGFPRSVPQAEALGKWLDERAEGLSVTINLDVPDEEIIGRLTARRHCPKCGAIYNLKFSPPRRGVLCDEDADTALVQRQDDKEETIRERLRIYHETTEPLLTYYRESGLLHSIPAQGLSPDEVFGSIEKVISALGVTKVP